MGKVEYLEVGRPRSLFCGSEYSTYRLLVPDPDPEFDPPPESRLRSLRRLSRISLAAFMDAVRFSSVRFSDKVLNRKNNNNYFFRKKN